MKWNLQVEKLYIYLCMWRLTLSAFFCTSWRSCSSLRSLCSRTASFVCKTNDNTMFVLLILPVIITCWYFSFGTQWITSASACVRLNLTHSDSSFSIFSRWASVCELLGGWFCSKDFQRIKQNNMCLSMSLNYRPQMQIAHTSDIRRLIMGFFSLSIYNI